MRVLALRSVHIHIDIVVICNYATMSPTNYARPSMHFMSYFIYLSVCVVVNNTINDDFPNYWAG